MTGAEIAYISIGIIVAMLLIALPFWLRMYDQNYYYNKIYSEVDKVIDKAATLIDRVRFSGKGFNDRMLKKLLKCNKEIVELSLDERVTPMLLGYLGNASANLTQATKQYLEKAKVTK